MKRHLILPFLLTLPAFAQVLTPDEKKELDALEPASTILFEADDSLNLRVAKAAKVVPHPRQLAWQELEFTCFVHFGINTFTGREWGDGKEEAKLFDPTAVDTDQWCRVAKEAGMKMMLITMKHHDGFCLWQTRYNDDFSVRKSPWKDGKGDVLRELSASCKKYGLKLGVYLSPADLYQLENKKGVYDNGSEERDSVIPTDPASFGSDPTRARKTPAGAPVFKYKVDDYNRLFLNQLYECLTEYGEVDEVWFDGANPKPNSKQKYSEEIWYEMIYALAPNATIAVGGPDVRWCGNEHGGTRSQEWSAMPLNGDPAIRKSWKFVDGVDHRSDDQGSRSRLAKADFIHWWPSEVDTSIRHGWFWRDENQGVRSAEEIYDIYERSIGSNSLLLLNVPPNRDGVFAPRDVAVLNNVGTRIRNTYGQPAAKLSEAVTDESTVYSFDKPTLINRVAIQEGIATHGQRVEKFAVDAWIDDAWSEISSGNTIGYKAILRISDVTTEKLRLRILEQRLTAKISHFSVHLDRAPLKAPTVQRDREGLVTIKGNGSLHYTLDGSTPTANSEKYTAAFSLPKGGIIKVIALRENESSEITTARLDIAKTKWKIHEVSSENPSSGEGAEKAIDGDPATIWHSKWSGGTDPMPHSITIDFGEKIDLKGFSYLPRSLPERGGILDEYEVELSRDAKKWVKASEGRFDNINNDPTQRDILFSRKYPDVRYLRLIGKHSIENKPHSSAAEIGIITR